MQMKKLWSRYSSPLMLYFFNIYFLNCLLLYYIAAVLVFVFSDCLLVCGFFYDEYAESFWLLYGPLKPVQSGSCLVGIN